MKKYNIGIIGATGTVGQRFILLLENHPWFNIKVLAASSKSANQNYFEAIKNKWVMEKSIPESIKNMKIYDAEKDIIKISSMVDFIFCAVNMEKQKIRNLEEMYAKCECPVVSNNSANRFTSDVPMIIPEINSDHMKIIPIQKNRLKTKKGFIAVKSNCSLQSYVPAIHPLLDLDINKILVCTYQAISGAGKTFKTWPEMVDNLIPFIDGEEEKSEKEPLKIWGNIKNNRIINNNSFNITSQCFRIPINNGHSAAVFMSFEKKISLEDIIKKWQNYKGIPQKLNLPSAPKQFLHYFKNSNMPQIKSAINLENGMSISIGRLREDSQYNIKFVCMSHNTLRGAAGGAILLAELLCAEGYIY